MQKYYVLKNDYDLYFISNRADNIVPSYNRISSMTELILED